MKWKIKVKTSKHSFFFISSVLSTSYNRSMDIVHSYLHRPTMPASVVYCENFTPVLQQNSSNERFVLLYTPPESQLPVSYQSPTFYNTRGQVSVNYVMMPNPSIIDNGHTLRFFWVPIQLNQNQGTYSIALKNTEMDVGNTSRIPQAPIRYFQNHDLRMDFSSSNALRILNSNVILPAHEQKLCPYGLDDSTKRNIHNFEYIISEYIYNFEVGRYHRVSLGYGVKGVNLYQIFKVILNERLTTYVNFLERGIKAEHVIEKINDMMSRGSEKEELKAHLAILFSIMLLNKNHAFSFELEKQQANEFVRRFVLYQFPHPVIRQTVYVQFHSVTDGRYGESIFIEDLFQLCLSRFLFIRGYFLGNKKHTRDLLTYLSRHGI